MLPSKLNNAYKVTPWTWSCYFIVHAGPKKPKEKREEEKEKIEKSVSIFSANTREKVRNKSSKLEFHNVKNRVQ